MPIKVQCKGCKKVLKAPDKARGKALKCPACGERIRVPAGKSSSAGQRSSSAKKRPPKKQKSEEDGLDFLAGIDLSDSSRIEDRHVKICPKCAAEVDEEDEICENCGVIIETGQLSKKEVRRRARRGPDPDEFYPIAWSDPWKFTLNHIKVILKTILIWTVFGTLYLCCFAMSGWCTNIPPKLFWLGLSVVSSLGLYGWFFYLQLEIIKLTFAKKEILKKTSADPFSAISLGLKLLVWQYVVMIPLWVIFLAIAPFLPIIRIPVFLFLLFLPAFIYPIAMTHFSMKYTYKAFLPFNLIKYFFNTMGASLYWLLVSFTVFLLNFILIGLGAWFISPLYEWFLGVLISFASWCAELCGSEAFTELLELSFMQYLFVGIGGVLLVGTFCLITSILLAPISIYIMRLTGLYGYYNQESLDLTRFQGADVKAPFGARYVAFIVDRFITGLFYVAILSIFMILAWGVMFMISTPTEEDAAAAALEPALTGMEFINMMFNTYRIPIVLGNLLMSYISYRYFITSITGPSQATLGKHALGIYVCDKKGKRLTIKHALTRFFYREILGTFTLGYSYILAAFNDEQETLHDKMTETQVLWKGDDDRS